MSTDTGRSVTDEQSSKPRHREEVARRSIWERLPRWISIPGFTLLLVLLWELIVRLGVTSELILPSPMTVAEELGSVMANIFTAGHVLENLWITTQESLIGFVLAAVFGIGLAVLVAETAFGRFVALPFLVGVNAAPKVAFAPLFVAWLGFGIWSKAALAAFIAFFPLLIDTAAGLASVDRQQERLFRSLRATWWQTFRRLKVPTAAPYIFAGLKTASVLAIVGAIVGEFLGGGSGMGELIRVSANQLRMARLFAYVAVLSVAGYLFYALIAWIEVRVVFWRSPDEMAVGQEARG